MRADAVMYEAKAQGRNRVQFHAAKAEAASVG
jgi:PleD family two-component response regulator